MRKHLEDTQTRTGIRQLNRFDNHATGQAPGKPENRHETPPKCKRQWELVSQQESAHICMVCLRFCSVPWNAICFSSWDSAGLHAGCSLLLQIGGAMRREVNLQRRTACRMTPQDDRCFKPCSIAQESLAWSLIYTLGTTRECKHGLLGCLVPRHLPDVLQ